MPPKSGKRKNRGKRLYKKDSPKSYSIINPIPISEDDKSYIFVVKNNTDNYRLDNPTAPILFELPRKHYYDMEANIRIYEKPTSLFLYNKESKIITGPFIGVTPVYKDNKPGVKFPSKINVQLMTKYLRIYISNHKVKEGVCSLQYINSIIYDSLPKLPRLDVGVQVHEKKIKKDTEHISESVFDSLDI